MAFCFLHQGNYESGLRILNINQNTWTLNQVAYFDAYPARTTSEFNGVWSVYPYFSSGLNFAILYICFICSFSKSVLLKYFWPRYLFGGQKVSRAILTAKAVNKG